MRSTSIRAAAVAALLAATSMVAAAAFAADAPTPKITSGVAKALSDAQKAIGVKDYPTALAAVKKAQDVSGRTPYDDFLINQFLMSADLGLNDTAGAAAAAEAAADSPAIPDAQKPGIYHNALALALNAKQYDKAVTYGEGFAGDQSRSRPAYPDDDRAGLLSRR